MRFYETKQFLEIYLQGNKIGNFTKHVQNLDKLEDEFAKEKAAIETIACDSLADFDKKYKELLLEHQANNAPQNDRFETFSKELDDIRAAKELPDTSQSQMEQSVINDVDGELTMQSAPFVTMDPITKKLIKNPVRNKNCNHVYDKEGIEEAIKMNSRLRCPYVGCNVRNVNREDLIEDRELKRKLMGMRIERNSE